jgi:Family of unknown function (DUF5996)
MGARTMWPDLPLAAWSQTCDTLQLWTQIVGKVRIALTPLINHWWNATFLVTARGLAALAMPCAGRTLDIIFDFVNHRLVIETSDGHVETFALKAMAIADFYNEFMNRLHHVGIDIHIWTMPGEIEDAIPFDEDRIHAQYDQVYAQKFWLALLQANRVLNDFRASFIGKASPVHFFWGSFDLAATRFSGRTAPPPKGVTPNVASRVMAESYSHEVSSCGFWPGNGGYGRAAFYVYAYPEPAGYGDTRLVTAEAFYDTGLGQFILPYDAVRQADDPDRLLLGFLQETYEAAAELAKWDRKTLERKLAAGRQ